VQRLKVQAKVTVDIEITSSPIRGLCVFPIVCGSSSSLD